jgi:hypothetical protein
MISNKAKWRGKDCEIVGRGKGQLATQVRIRYLSKKGNPIFKLIDERDLDKAKAKVQEPASKEFTREPFRLQTIGWPEFKSKQKN